MPYTLNTHQVVMELDFQDSRVAGFVGYRDDDEDISTLQLLRDVWEGMGEPSEVTVTVEPGDKLNR